MKSKTVNDYNMKRGYLLWQKNKIKIKIPVLFQSGRMISNTFFYIIAFLKNVQKAKGPRFRTIVQLIQLYNLLYYLYILQIKTYVHNNILSQ